MSALDPRVSSFEKWVNGTVSGGAHMNYCVIFVGRAIAVALVLGARLIAEAIREANTDA